MKKKLIYLSVGLMVLCSGCSSNKNTAANQTASPSPVVDSISPTETASPSQQTSDASALVVQKNEPLAFQLAYDNTIFTYSEYNEGINSAYFAAERGISGNIMLSVSTREVGIDESIEQLKMQQYVQKFTQEDTVIGKNKIPVTCVRFYDESMSDVVTYGYVWEHEVDGTKKTYVLEVFDLMKKDGVESRQNEFQSMLDSFELN